ncbi:hypothetical protein [Chamaesiphon sp.]|uniref:LIC_10190 family membrane protein n=1 Tax=Chamaesiphon sp. TaxID=2814140 RepID=UPI003594701C
MLYFILVWTLLLIGCGGCGFGLLNLLKIRSVDRVGDRAIIAVWLGMLTIAIALLASALVVPLSPQFGGGLLIIFFLLSMRSTRLELFALSKRISKRQISIYVSAAIAIAALFAQPVIWDDSGLYHYSLVHWFAKFGTVPGLALLFPNFGFTSAWFAFSAPLNPEWLSDRTMATANGFVLLLAILQLSIGIDRLLRQQAQLSDWFITIYYSCVLSLTMGANLMPAILVSPSPDIPALLIVAMTVWAIVAVETNAATKFAQERQIVPLILAVGAVSIKLVTLPLLLVTGLWFVFRAGFGVKLGQRIGILAVVSLLLIPFLLSSVTTSGCPLYPSSALCLDLPWTIVNDRATANSTHHWISWYGTPDPGIHPWVWAFQHWIVSGGNKFTAGMIAISIGCAIYLLKTRSHRHGSIVAIAIAGVGIGFFLLTAPFNRFMLPYLFIVPALALATYCRSHLAIDSIFVRLTLAPIKFASLGLLSIALVLAIIRVQTSYSLLLLPPAIAQTATIERQVNDVTYFAPASGLPRCWTNKLPCAYDLARIRLRDPDRGIQAGFIRN